MNVQQTTVLSKQEAIAAMLRGEKVTHQYFLEDEYIYMKSGGDEIFSEDGVNHGLDFWKIRHQDDWNTDWLIYN